jgi:MFS family permease
LRDLLALLWSLLLAVSLLLLGTGMFNTFIGLRAAMEGFPQSVIGLMMSAFYGGFVAGTLRSGRLINRIGHIRAFGTFCALSASVACLFPFVVSEAAWVVLRAVLGFNLAALYMIAESWLNTKATTGNRGTLLSIYMMVCYLALGGGQLALNLGDPAGTDLFMIAAMMFSLAVVPVAVTRATNPEPVEAPYFGFRRLYQISPVAMVGCVCSGLITGALFGMGPVYGRDIGLSLTEISFFMSIVIVSGLLFQLPIGRASDRYDRRSVITMIASTALVVSIGMAALTRYHAWILGAPVGREILVLGALFGGVTATLYPLCVAYANDYIEPAERLPASGGLVLAYGVGAAFGPTGAGTLMGAMGPSGLFGFSAVVCAALVGLALYRRGRRAWAGVTPKERFVALPEATATPAATEVDPRFGGPQSVLDFGRAGAFPQTAEVLKGTQRRWRARGQ